jgi:hypothetical protein
MTRLANDCDSSHLATPIMTGARTGVASVAHPLRGDLPLQQGTDL